MRNNYVLGLGASYIRELTVSELWGANGELKFWTTCGFPRSLSTEISWTNSGVRARISNYIHVKHRAAIIHPYSSFNSGLVKLLLKMWHGWVIIFHRKKNMDVITYACPKRCCSCCALITAWVLSRYGFLSVNHSQYVFFVQERALIGRLTGRVIGRPLPVQILDSVGSMKPEDLSFIVTSCRARAAVSLSQPIAYFLSMSQCNNPALSCGYF